MQGMSNVPSLHALSRPTSSLSFTRHPAFLQPMDYPLAGIPSRPTSALSFGYVQPLQPSAQTGKKRKRKSESEKQEQSSKRIALSQNSYRLPRHQDLALRPSGRITVAALQEAYRLPEFLVDYQASPYQRADPIDRDTLVDTWQSIRLFEGEFKPSWQRVQAFPPTNQEAAAADTVLYTKEPATADATASARLHGELRCLFLGSRSDSSPE